MAKPEVVTNRGERTVALAINEVLDTVFSHPHNIDHEVWIATAYFNPAGFELLAEQLERVGNVRLLLGAEPQPADAGPRPLTTGGPRQRNREALRRGWRATPDLSSKTAICSASASRPTRLPNG